MTGAAPLPCLRCGVEDWDVRMTLVETPEEERQRTRVSIEHERRKGQLPEIEYREVPEIYAREPRCRDRQGCDERVASNDLAAIRARAAEEPAPEPEKAWVI